MMRFLLLLLLLFPGYTEYGGCCLARSGRDDDRVLMVSYPVEPVLRWQGDTLVLSFTCSLKGRLENPLSLHIAPLYVSGTDTLRYPAVNCLTPSGARFRHRRSILQGAAADGNDLVIRNGGRKELQYSYEERLVVPRSMHGKFRMLHYVQDCCSTWHLEERKVAVPVRSLAVTDTLPSPVAVVSVPLFEANVTFVKPSAEAVKRRSATVTVRVNYPVNHWQVDPSYLNNHEELARVHGILSPVQADKDVYTVTHITISGYASPEDSYHYNRQLTRKRAEGMRDYLLQRYDLSGCYIRCEGMGEDWDGLRKGIAASDMPARQELMDIIDNYGIFNYREKRMMELQRGEPYRYMMKHLFPPLRRMEMKIDYTVRALGTDEAGEFIEGRPQDLSLEEIYSLARAKNTNHTILHRRDEYGKEYDIAVRYYPDDAVAHINAASAALVRGDMEQAWLYLSKVQDHPLASNNIGVYCWLCGRTADARSYFGKALAVDAARAAYNLQQLDKWEKEFVHDGVPPGH